MAKVVKRSKNSNSMNGNINSLNESGAIRGSDRNEKRKVSN